jgi:hypothetical protein
MADKNTKMSGFRVLLSELSNSIYSLGVSIEGGNVTSESDTVTDNFNTATGGNYLADEIISDDTFMTFNTVSTNNGKGVMIAGAKLEFSLDTVPTNMGGYSLYLFNTQPTNSVLTDTSTFSVTTDEFISKIAFSTPIDEGGKLVIIESEVNNYAKLDDDDNKLYGILKTGSSCSITVSTNVKASLNVVTI